MDKDNTNAHEMGHTNPVHSTQTSTQQHNTAKQANTHDNEDDKSPQQPHITKPKSKSKSANSRANDRVGMMYKKAYRPPEEVRKEQDELKKGIWGSRLCIIPALCLFGCGGGGGS